MNNDLAEMALQVGVAVANHYSSVVIGSDTRTSSEAMKHAVSAGLLFGGGKYADAGVVPTPTVGFAAREFDAGVMITASHNPPEYNGIKLLNPNGSAFDGRQRQQMEKLLQDYSYHVAPWDKIGNSNIYADAIERHINRILQDFPTRLKLKVVVDCGCGATSLVTPYLLQKMGCEVIAVNCYPSGFFPHDAEPVASNLSDLMKTTRELGADVGIAHDGDGDRLMAVDDRGRFVSGDQLLAILAQQTGAKTVVTTIDASMIIEEMGFKVKRTPVGDIYVSEELQKGGDFGGEPSGAWVFPCISLCPDGIYAAARIAAIASQQKLSLLADAIPEYPLRRGSTSSHGVVISKLEKQLMALDPLSMSNTDGMRLAFKDGWLLVRPSGTEPKIRLTAEAKSEARLRQLYDRGIQAIEQSTEGNR